MTFKKLALVTAMAMLPMSAMAVDVLDDETMSGVTGQDGIRISLDLNLNTNVTVHDVDGIRGYTGTVTPNEFFDFTNIPGNPGDPANVDGTLIDEETTAAGIKYVYALPYVQTLGQPGLVGADQTVPLAPENFNYEHAGAIVITGMSLVATGVQVDIDAGASAQFAGDPVLNIGVDLTNGATINTGTIGVANSRRDDGNGDPALNWGYDGVPVDVLQNMEITIGQTLLNIQLGNEPQGHMIRIDTSIGNGVNIVGFGMSDANSGGTIGAAGMALFDNGGTDLTVGVGIDVEGAGLRLTVNELGSAQGVDLQLTGLYMGGAAAGAGVAAWLADNTVDLTDPANRVGFIGDVEMNGLNMNGSTIMISGK